jgi:hypothetical protein
LSSEHGERRLAADVAGSCGLIAIDDPKITDHRGRIVKNTANGAQFSMAWRAFDLSQWRATSEGTSFSKMGQAGNGEKP